MGSEKESGNLRLLVTQLTPMIAKESISQGYASIIVVDRSGSRKSGTWTGQHKGGAHSSVPSARRLELNFEVVPISANEQKAKFEIQLLDGWVHVLEQNELGLMQSSSEGGRF